MLLLRRLLLILALCAGAGTGFGAGFDPPGLAADSAAYLRGVSARDHGAQPGRAAAAGPSAGRAAGGGRAEAQ